MVVYLNISYNFKNSYQEKMFLISDTGRRLWSTYSSHRQELLLIKKKDY